jgi:hypothetical protein
MLSSAAPNNSSDGVINDLQLDKAKVLGSLDNKRRRRALFPKVLTQDVLDLRVRALALDILDKVYSIST